MHSSLFSKKRWLFVPVVFLAVLSLFISPSITSAKDGGGGGGGGGSTGSYQQTNLVSNGTQAPVTDPHLINPWGLVSSTSGPWWISDNFSGLSTLYNGQGQIASLVVTVPTPAGTAGTLSTPTGIVFNTSSSFVVSQNGVSGASVFLFATADGTISGWNPKVNGTNAIVGVNRANVGTGTVYRGLALANTSSGSFLYATNFHARTIEQFDGNFNLVRSFTDPAAVNCSSSGSSSSNVRNSSHGGGGGGGGGGGCFAPFGIQVIGSQVFVTFVLQNESRTDHFGVAGNGSGFVDVFDTNGNLVHRLTSSSQLNAPWGLALAPANFGTFSNDLLVGNFGDGHINAFDPNTGNFVGQLATSNGPISIDGLWAIKFGNGATAGTTNQLFFTAGPEDGHNGLFGSIQSLT